MIGTIDIKVNAKCPNIHLPNLAAFINSPTNIRVIDVPKKIGLWKIDKVYITAAYPDNRIESTQCVLVGGAYVGTIQGSSTVGKSTNGYAITADGTDEHGNVVTGYVLGKGDITILDTDGQITVGETTYYLHLLSAVPEVPHKADVTIIDGKIKLYDGETWREFGSDAVWGNINGELSDQTDLVAQLNQKADLSSIPLSVSELVNDSNFITHSDISSDFAKKRDKLDLSVYTQGYTDWTGNYPDDCSVERQGNGWAIYSHVFGDFMTPYQGNEQSLNLHWNAGEGYYDYEISATRSKSDLPTATSVLLATKPEVQCKRDIDDLSVVHDSTWECEPELMTDCFIDFDSSSDRWFIYSDASGVKSPVSIGKGDATSTHLEWNDYDWVGGYALTANFIDAYVETLTTKEYVDSLIGDLETTIDRI